jgi:hypothetical protein
MEVGNSWWHCQKCNAYNPKSTICRCGHDPETRQVAKDGDCESEAGLHDQIEAHLRGVRWPYVHSRMDKPSHNALGVSDFVILAPKGKTLILEIKTRSGKQRPEQLGWQIMCERNGHIYHLVRSYSQYLDILKANEL